MFNDVFRTMHEEQKEFYYTMQYKAMKKMSNQKFNLTGHESQSNIFSFGLLLDDYSSSIIFINGIVKRDTLRIMEKKIVMFFVCLVVAMISAEMNLHFNGFE